MAQQNLAISRRQLIQAAVGAAASGGASLLSFAQGNWPNRPVTLLVPYPPGGQTDFAGRAVHVGLGAALGQPVVVDNKGGANGNLGTFDVLRSQPDGYKLLIGNSNMTINPYTYSSPSPDPLALTPIGLILQSSLILCVNNDVPVRSLQEFIAWVKQQDATRGGIAYASSGPGSISQASMELLREHIGKPRMTHVPYKGSAPAVIDLIAGHESAMFEASSVVAPYIRAGKIRPLVTTGTTRVPAFPDIPTATELGLKDLVVYSFIGLYGPPGLPAEIVSKANSALNASLDATVRKSILDFGDEPGGGAPERLGAMTREFHKRWGEVVKRAGIKAE